MHEWDLINSSSNMISISSLFSYVITVEILIKLSYENIKSSPSFLDVTLVQILSIMNFIASRLKYERFIFLTTSSDSTCTIILSPSLHFL